MRTAYAYPKAQVISLPEVKLHNDMMACMGYLNSIKQDVIKGNSLTAKPLEFAARDINTPVLEYGVIYISPSRETVYLEETEITLYNLIYAYLKK